MSDVAMWPDPFNGQDHVVRVIEEHMDAFKLYRYTYVQALATPDGKEVRFCIPEQHESMHKLSSHA